MKGYRPGYTTIFICLVSLLFTGCYRSRSDNKIINISAAISMKDVLGTIKEKYEVKDPGVAVHFNFASSGTLQQQIEQGAPVDVFISAGNKQMKALDQQGLVSQIQTVAGNRLVLITPKAAGSTMESLKGLTDTAFERIAVGTPDTVPAGKYAEESLKNSGLLDRIKPRLVMAKDVRQVLTYVETGNAEAGFVYATDAKSSDKVKVAFVVPTPLHSPILYPAALVNASSNKAEAERFLKFLRSDEAKEIFKAYGFTGPE